MDRFLSAFEIETSPKEDEYKGSLSPLSGEPRTGCPARMGDYRNTHHTRRKYEENFLEDWVARCPQSVFPNEDVHVIASQNYAHLPKKVDLLLANYERGFFVVEAKIDKVTENGPETPWRIGQQMGRYVRFLGTYLADYPKSFGPDYARFSSAFFRERRKPPAVDRSIQESGPPLTEVYLTAGYDDISINDLTHHAAQRHHNLKLFYYRFFPVRPRHVIEFWESDVITENQFRGSKPEDIIREVSEDVPIVRNNEFKPTIQGDPIMSAEDTFDINEIINPGPGILPGDARRRCFLFGKKKATTRVQYICVAHLFQGRAIHTFGLLDESYKRTGTPEQRIIDGISRIGHEIDPPGINVKNVAAWVQYGKAQARELGLIVEGEPN